MSKKLGELFGYYRGSEVIKEIGVCKLKSEGLKTVITCPSITLDVDHVKVDIQSVDHTKVTKSPIGDDNYVIKEADGTEIVISQDYNNVNIDILSPSKEIEYNVIMLPDPLAFLPFMNKSFTKEFLYGGASKNSCTATSVYDLAANMTERAIS